MKPFNPKTVVISRFNLLTTLFTHGLLTACNHVGTYHAIEDQASTKEASSTPIEHSHKTEAEKERIVAQKLDALYNKICDFRRYSPNSQAKAKTFAECLIAFKKAVENKNVPFYTALKECSNRTGRMLSYNDLYYGIYTHHHELIAQVIYADVVDGTNDRECFDRYCRKRDDASSSVESEKIRIIRYALSCMDKIKSNDPLEQYKGYNHLKQELKNQSVPPYAYTQIDIKIIDLLHKLIEIADTSEKRKELAKRMSAEDVALFRHKFQIKDEEDPDGNTNVLYPNIYRILSENGYSIALDEGDASRVKTYLKKNYPHSFNQVQPYVPSFHDEASREDMLLNKAYVDMHDAFNRGEGYLQLDELYKLAIEKNVRFQEVLRRCKENTGLMLSIANLPRSIYSTHCNSVMDLLSAGVVAGYEE